MDKKRACHWHSVQHAGEPGGWCVLRGDPLLLRELEGQRQPSGRFFGVLDTVPVTWSFVSIVDFENVFLFVSIFTFFFIPINTTWKMRMVGEPSFSFFLQWRVSLRDNDLIIGKKHFSMHLWWLESRHLITYSIKRVSPKIPMDLYPVTGTRIFRAYHCIGLIVR